MKYTCVRCGKQFEAKHKTAVCADCHTAVCVVCGRTFDLQTPWTQKTCSPKCRGIYRKQSGIAAASAAKSKQTLLSRYGVENAQKLQKFTRICKFCGKQFVTEHANQIYCNDVHYGECPVCGKRVKITDMSIGPQACSEECKQVRIQQTCLSKYGVTAAVNSVHARELAKQTCLDKYGVDHYSKSQEYREKYNHTMVERYGTTIPLRNAELLDKLRSTCKEKYGVEFNCMRPECRASYRTISKINQAFEQLLSSLEISSQLEFSLGRYSYDFKVSETLVEIDPTITHNSTLSIFPECEPTSVDYHLNKTRLAKENSYRCIHVFDWDDWDKIIDLIRPKRSVYARNCTIADIDRRTAEEFTSRYHISGKCNGQIVNYGLYYKGELVEVMTFGKPRYNKKYDFELLRLCSASDVRVVGGASKLFKQFVQHNPGMSVISYCDLSKFSGDVYQKIGMTLVRITPPNKIWSKGHSKITQNLLNQRGYDQLFKTNYGKGTSNEQLMLDSGWLPVYDCGQLVFEYCQSRNS